jgi:YggT family protein
VSGQISGIVGSIGYFYTILIVVYTLMSWLPMRGIVFDTYRVLASVVEPYVGVFRRFIPPISNIDLSPWAAILALQFIIVPVLQAAVRALVR